MSSTYSSLPTWARPTPRLKAQPSPFPASTATSFCTKAREARVSACCGLSEADGDRVYRAATLVNGSGEILLRCRTVIIANKPCDFDFVDHSPAVLGAAFV